MFSQSGEFSYLNIPQQNAPSSSTFRCQSANLEFYFKENYSNEAWKEQRQHDQQFIKTFLSKMRINKIADFPKNSLKIFEAKQLLIDTMSLKRKLENEAFNLDVNDKTFDAQWELIKKKTANINDNLNKIQLNLKALQRKLYKRLKNREGKKKKKDNKKIKKKERQNEIETKHKTIDQLLSEKLGEVSDAKREIMLKIQADAVLHEVRKKKYEAKKMLKMLSALSKLRELRVKQEEDRGGYCSKQLTETFNKVIERFQLLWEKQIELYKLEEKGLMIMLGENAMPLLKESKFETNLLHWEEILFGNISVDIKEKLLTAADNNLEALIHIRRNWDNFITKEATPMSSSMPVGWVLPSKTNDEDWKKFIFGKKKLNL